MNAHPSSQCLLPLMAAGSLLLLSACTAPLKEEARSGNGAGSSAATTPLEVLKQRAGRGDANAQYALGLEYGRRYQFQESNEWYLRAAEHCHARAQHMMGVRFVFGQGVERNPAEAMKWFTKAAAQGEPNAQFSLGLRYVRGEGVPKDFSKASQWFKRAADQGHAEAQRSLGRRHAAGEGVRQNRSEALKWYLVAAAHGDGESKVLSTKLTQTMSPAEVADAMVAAARFVPKTRY